MQTLLLMRHAKSSWADSGQPDHERPLNERGIRVAPQMGEFLKRQGVLPDLIVSSSAVRARQTAKALAEVLSTEVVIEEELYMTTHFEWANILQRYEDQGTLLSIGHNPTIESFLQSVSHESHRMPTAAIARFSVQAGQQKLIERLTLEEIWRPKEVLD